MASDTTHACPAPNCEQRVPFHVLACRPHWFSIPKPIRDRLNAEYSENFGERSYFEARAACLRALGVPEQELAAANGGVT
jgi:hypothetical protein